MPGAQPTRVRVRRRDCNCQSGRLTGVDLAASAPGSDRPLNGRRRCFSRPCDGRLIPFHHGKFAPNESGVRPWKPVYPVAPRARAAMRRHGGPAKRAGRHGMKRAGRHGIMCPSPHHGGTDRGCTLLPSADLAPVQKRLRPFSAQFHDFRPVRAQIAPAWRRTLRIMVRIVRQGKDIARYWDLWEKIKCARSVWLPQLR